MSLVTGRKWVVNFFSEVDFLHVVRYSFHTEATAGLQDIEELQISDEDYLEDYMLMCMVS